MDEIEKGSDRVKGLVSSDFTARVSSAETRLLFAFRGTGSVPVTRFAVPPPVENIRDSAERRRKRRLRVNYALANARRLFE